MRIDWWGVLTLVLLALSAAIVFGVIWGLAICSALCLSWA